MIKKSIVYLILLLSVSQIKAQKVQDLFTEYSKVQNVECVKLNKFLTTCIKPFAKELKGIDAIQVLDLSDCSTETKQSFTQKVKKLKDKNYETLLRTNEENEYVQILVSIKKETIREFVVITSGEDCTLVRIKGKLKKSHINSLVNR